MSFREGITSETSIQEINSVCYIVDGMQGKRLRYIDLIQDNGLP